MDSSSTGDQPTTNTESPVPWLLNLTGQRDKNHAIKAKIDSYLKLVTKACQDQYALQEAKNLVPIAKLVQDNLEVLEGNYQENLLPLLVDWFSNEFFRWFSPPDCEKCNEGLDLHGTSVNIEGRVVENYRCNNGSCKFAYDFIRHNDPAILLTTRQGRCGEWANCFMLILRALDYETRLVIDTTDHVWNEVWSEAHQRWIHVDPCEGSIDTPLLYEIGWAKKLEYCLAFSQYEVLDVTRRYSAHFNVTLGRRNSCEEDWLEHYLDKLTSELLDGVSIGAKDNILRRRVQDKNFMRELASKPRYVATDMSKLQRRKTGNISWRLQRGEYSPILKNFCIIKVVGKDKEIDNITQSFTLRYNSVRNTYDSSSEDYKQKDWSSLTYLCENLDYKYEKDWKTSYVSRYETCPYNQEGKVQWKFDMSTFSHWTKLELQVNCNIYPGTSIDLYLFSYDKNEGNQLDEIKLELNTLNTLTSEQFKPDTIILDVIAKLIGGDPNDSVAWQKPQLFRQTRGTNSDEWAFTLKIC